MICDGPKSIGALLVVICTCLAEGFVACLSKKLGIKNPLTGQYVEKARKLNEAISDTNLTLAGSNPNIQSLHKKLFMMKMTMADILKL